MDIACVFLDINANIGIDKYEMYKIGVSVSFFIESQGNLDQIRKSLKFAHESSDGICIFYNNVSWHNLQKAFLMEFERSSIFVEDKNPYVIAKGFKKEAEGVFFDNVYGKPVLMVPYDLNCQSNLSVFNHLKGENLRIGLFEEKVKNDFVVYADEVETILSVNSRELEQLKQNINEKNIYTSCGESPQQSLFNILATLNVTVSTAESCTAGIVSGKIADLPGVSGYFKGGCVTYSNELKSKFLSVNVNTLNNFGAVSKEVAEQMALGILHKSGSDYAVSITGIAGPSGATRDKPVGLVYFSAVSHKDIKTVEKIFTGNRKIIREKAAKFALLFLRQFILESV